MSKDIKKRNEEILLAIGALAKKYEVPESAIGEIIRSEMLLREIEKDKAQTEANKQYVGRYFADTTSDRPRYYKVVSERATSAKAVSCLCVDEDVYAWFMPEMHLHTHVHDGIGGEFEFNAFPVESVWIADLLTYQEISEAEFAEKAKQFVEKMLMFDWTDVEEQ